MGPHVTSPKFPPLLWKGQRSQLCLKYREVWSVLMGCVWGYGKPSALPEAGSKVGNCPLNVVKPRSHLPSLVVWDLQPPQGGISRFRWQGAALQQSLSFPAADLPGHRWPVPTMGTSRLSGGRQRQSPVSPLEHGWRNRQSCHGDFLPSRCSGQVQEEALPPSLCGTMPARSCSNRKPLQPPA